MKKIFYFVFWMAFSIAAIAQTPTNTPTATATYTPTPYPTPAPTIEKRLYGPYYFTDNVRSASDITASQFHGDVGSATVSDASKFAHDEVDWMFGSLAAEDEVQQASIEALEARPTPTPWEPFAGENVRITTPTPGGANAAGYVIHATSGGSTPTPMPTSMVTGAHVTPVATYQFNIDYPTPLPTSTPPPTPVNTLPQPTEVSTPTPMPTIKITGSGDAGITPIAGGYNVSVPTERPYATPVNTPTPPPTPVNTLPQPTRVNTPTPMPTSMVTGNYVTPIATYRFNVQVPTPQPTADLSGYYKTDGTNPATKFDLTNGRMSIFDDGTRVQFYTDKDLFLNPVAGSKIIPATMMEFPDDLGDKIRFYSHSYSVGVSPFDLDFTSDKYLRWHSDTNEDAMVLNGDTGDLTIEGKFTGDGSGLTDLSAGQIPDLSGVYLPLSGGTMSGDINMGANDITNISHLGGTATGEYITIDNTGDDIEFTAGGNTMLELQGDEDRVQINTDITASGGIDSASLALSETATIKTTKTGAGIWNGSRFYNLVYGSAYHGGAVYNIVPIIRLGPITNDLFKARISVYEVGETSSYDVIVSSFYYSGFFFYNDAELFGSSNIDRVRIGLDGDSNLCIALGEIGDTWRLPIITVDAEVGYTPDSDWGKDARVIFETDDSTNYTWSVDRVPSANLGAGLTTTDITASGGIDSATLETSGDVYIGGDANVAGIVKGASYAGLGSAAWRSAEDTLTDGENLPDGAAVKAFVEGKGYITDGNTNWNNSYGFITDANDTVTETELDTAFFSDGAGLLAKESINSYRTYGLGDYLEFSGGDLDVKDNVFAAYSHNHGSGSANYVTKWSNTSGGLTSSIIYDNGSFVGIGVTSRTGYLENLRVDAGIWVDGWVQINNSSLNVGTTGYFGGNVSAESFTDRCEYPEDSFDALSAVAAIRPATPTDLDWGELDHDSLPAHIIRSATKIEKTYKITNRLTKDVVAEIPIRLLDNRTDVTDVKELLERDDDNVVLDAKTSIDDLEAKLEEKEIVEKGRDLGGMVSVNSKAIQQLLDRIEALEARVAALEKTNISEGRK